MGSLIKTVFARKLNVSPDRIVTVGIMPCVAKKDEIERPQLKDANGKKETEYVLTTRELGRLLRESHIAFGSLKVCCLLFVVCCLLFVVCCSSFFFFVHKLSRILNLTRLLEFQLALLHCLLQLEVSWKLLCELLISM